MLIQHPTPTLLSLNNPNYNDPHEQDAFRNDHLKNQVQHCSISGDGQLLDVQRRTHFAWRQMSSCKNRAKRPQNAQMHTSLCLKKHTYRYIKSWRGLRLPTINNAPERRHEQKRHTQKGKSDIYGPICPTTTKLAPVFAHKITSMYFQALIFAKRTLSCPKMYV